MKIYPLELPSELICIFDLHRVYCRSLDVYSVYLYIFTLLCLFSFSFTCRTKHTFYCPQHLSLILMLATTHFSARISLRFIKSNYIRYKVIFASNNNYLRGLQKLLDLLLVIHKRFLKEYLQTDVSSVSMFYFKLHVF